MKRVIIAGGGTGGHFYPGFALALKLREKGAQPLFAVKKNDISLQILKENEIPFVEIDAVSLPRSLNLLKHLIFLLKLFSSFFYCLDIIKDFSPKAVLATGSYVAFPMAAAAKLKKVKVYLHESNSIMGISNRLAGFFADKIFCGLPLRENPFPDKTILAGIPLRDSFDSQLTQQQARKKLGLDENAFIILIFGGSQGSRSINEAFYKTALDLSYEKKQLPFFIHLSGKNNYQELKEKYEKAGLGDKGLIFPYYDDMPTLYCACDLVISRSGSGSVYETYRYRKPAIFIPLKTAAGDHQTFNAFSLSSHGCAIILKDEEHLASKLKETLEKLLKKENLSAMKKAYERVELPSSKQAQELITEKLLEN